MLRIYDVLLECVRALKPFLDRVAQHDADLARQGRRALASAPLNVAEGSVSRGRNRGARYHSAAGSVREVIACIEVATALGYVESFDPVLLNTLHKIVATLRKAAL